MNYLFYFIMLFAFSLSTNNVYGQSAVSTKNTNNGTKGSAVVNKVWIEHNTTMNDKSGITIHTDLNVKGMKGKKIEVLSYFYDSGKNKMMGGVTGYKTQSGQVSHSYTTTPSYESSHWEDFKLFIPYSALPSLSNNQTYYVSIRVFDVSSSEFINDKVYTAFKGPNRGSNPSNLSNQPSLIGTWKLPVPAKDVVSNLYLTFSAGQKTTVKNVINWSLVQLGNLEMTLTIPGTYILKGKTITLKMNTQAVDAKFTKIQLNSDLAKEYKEIPEIKKEIDDTFNKMKVEMKNELKKPFSSDVDFEIVSLTNTTLKVKSDDDVMTYTKTK